MKKFVLIPDSFKGTLSSANVCNIMKECILQHYPQAQISSIPVADGGEGSVDAFLTAVGGKRITVQVSDPYGKHMHGFWGQLTDGTAVVEMAACAGLPLVGENLNPERTTTYGVGELILAAAKQGCKKLIVGLGGSCTNDGGAGMAAALGIRFFNDRDQAFVPTGGTLHQIKRIDGSGLAPQLKEMQITAMCDIDNPLCGENGAAHIFGPQKGADAAMVRRLDAGLAHLASIIQRDLGVAAAHLPGSGAAGGMGAGMVAFLGARLKMGIEVVLDAVDFDRIAAGADMVFTGEGRLDTQSLRGKVIAGVAQHTKRLGIPLVAVVGAMEQGIEPAYAMGVSAVFSINTKAMDFSQSRNLSHQNLCITMGNLLRLIKTIDK